MRVVVLSDHGGEQLERTSEQLRAATQNLAASHDTYRAVYADLQTARRDKPLWKKLFKVATAAEQQALAAAHSSWGEVVHAGESRRRVHDRAQQQAAGQFGEDVLAWALSVLPDEWVMLRGYRNRRGETDHVLVGPAGIWVVEVKRRRVRLNAVGDQWWYEKLDRRRRVVDNGWAIDGGGRSWARQVNDVATDLIAWLTRNGHQAPVYTAVMVMHEQALIGRCQNPTVSVIGTHPQHLLNAIRNSHAPLGAQACDEIVRLIHRDHTFHRQRRQPKKPR